MFPSGTNTFLRVGDARRIPRRLLLPEKKRNELVHPRVCEEQVRRIREERRRRHDGVLLFAKEIEKGLADFGGGPDSSRDGSANRKVFTVAAVSDRRRAAEPVRR